MTVRSSLFRYIVIIVYDGDEIHIPVRREKGGFQGRCRQNRIIEEDNEAAYLCGSNHLTQNLLLCVNY